MGGVTVLACEIRDSPMESQGTVAVKNLINLSALFFQVGVTIQVGDGWEGDITWAGLPLEHGLSGYHMN